MVLTLKANPTREKHVNLCLPYTMTQAPRLQVLWNLVELTSIKYDLKGAYLEAGVYKGGSSMLMAYALKEFNKSNKLYLFDKFKGMTYPTEKDKKINKTGTFFEKWEMCKKDFGIVDWCYASLDSVKENMGKTKYDNIEYIEGDVLNTISKNKLNDLGLTSISLLRIDTDFYESTRHILDHLFYLVEDKGFIVFDDYNCWQGANEAVNEFFIKNNLDKKDIVSVDHSCSIYQKVGIV